MKIYQKTFPETPLAFLRWVLSEDSGIKDGISKAWDDQDILRMYVAAELIYSVATTVWANLENKDG